jgi:hypothetical protein
VYPVTRAGRSTIAVVDIAAGRPTTVVSSEEADGLLSFAVIHSLDRVVYLEPGPGAASDPGELRVIGLPPAD